MKRKKGFTLIELLAVVVVLAVILVIAVPKILEVIENAQKQAYKESVELMAHTARLQYQTGEVTGGVAKIPEGGIIYEFAEGEYTTSNTLNFKGEKPFSGTITLTEDKKVIITDLISNDKKWCAKKDVNEKQARVGKRTDPGFNCKIEGEDEIIIKDESSCELATNDDKTEYYIDSPSDLYAFSQSVNSGDIDYSGKTVKVRNNLDMSKAEGECVTNFEPIGTEDDQFRGTFDGGGKTISNLTINQPDLDYVGLFGYVLGTSSTDAKIFGVILDEHTVIGGSGKTGGLIGYSKYTTTTEIMLKKVTVEGKGDVGGLHGRRQYGTVNKILVKFAQVTGDEKDGYVGSVAGYDGSSNFDQIIVEKAILSGPSGSTDPIGGNKTSIKTYSNDVIVNEVNVVDGFDPNGINDINFYEAVGLDTWIGGEDNTGYYFDYDKNNNIVLKSIEKDPITFNLSQDEDGYYLIKTAKDWKEASSKVTEKYKVDNDLDFSSNKYYMLGSIHNKFSGELDGNDKTISNVIINGNKSDYIGLIGYAQYAIIHSLNFKKIEIHGYDYVGIFGYVNEKNFEPDLQVYSIVADGLIVTGNQFVGGIVGYGNYLTILEVLVDNIEIHGNDDVGGLIGKRSYGTLNNVILRGGSVIGENKTKGNIGSVTGTNGASNFSEMIVEEIKVYGPEGTTYPIAGSETIKTYSNNVKINDVNETEGFDPKGINDINFYEAVGLDTWIGGDINNTGHYFDYDSKGKIVLKGVEKYPFPNELKILENGSGTPEDPYLIKTPEDWRKISAYSNKVNLTVKLDNDLDFSSSKYYMLGSYDTPFNGLLIGNDKTISNVTINGEKANYVGLFGYVLQGTLHSFKTKNITIHGYNNVGIFGYINEKNYDATLQIYSIIADELTVTGNQFVGGLVGYGNYLKIIEILLDNIEIHGNIDVGGLIGRRQYGTLNNVLLKSGTIIGDDKDIGSVTGYNGSSNFSNMIVEKIEVYGPEGNIYPIAGNESIKTYSNNVKLNGVNVTDGFDPALVGNLEYYADVLETLYTGDANNTGYFFDYDPSKNGIYLKKAYSLTFTSPSSDDTEDTNTEGGGTQADNCYITISCSGSGKYRNCYINYYENGVNEAPVLNGFNFNLTQGSSCAAYSLSNTPSGANFYVKKKSSSSCSVTFRASTSADCATTTYKTISF